MIAKIYHQRGERIVNVVYMDHRGRVSHVKLNSVEEARVYLKARLRQTHIKIEEY